MTFIAEINLIMNNKARDLQSIMNFQLILLFLLVFLTTNSPQNLTQFYSKQLGYNLSYQVWSGYEDINWYTSLSQTSIYYCLWQSSTRSFADHSVPLIFWLQGGPGISSQFGSFQSFGPIKIQSKAQSFSVLENPWSWNYYGHLVFVDEPAGTGLSYNRGKEVDNLQTATQHFINFIYNFFENDQFQLRSNPIYLAGEGYAGHLITSFAKAINSNTTLGIKISGLLLGGAEIDPELQTSHYDAFLYSTGTTSQNWRDTTRYMQNEAILNMKKGDLSKSATFTQTILSPSTASERYGGISVHNYKLFGNEEAIIHPYVSFINSFKKQLGIPPSITFTQQNSSIKNAFSSKVSPSSRKNLASLLEKDIKVLLYSGQNDLKTNTIGILNVLENLDWKGKREWLTAEKEIWSQSGRNVGWFKKYENLIFVMLRNTGHYVYEKESGKTVWYMLNNYFYGKW